jgi:hypothetical protein
MSSVFIFSYVFTLPQKANIFISGKLLRLDWKKKDRNQKMGAGKQLTALPGTHHPFSNDDGDLPNPCQFELGMAEGVGSEPFLPSFDQNHKAGYATSLNGSS